MFIPYADEKMLCNTLAEYKIGDIVSTLINIRTKEGIIEAGTKVKITDIKLNTKIITPQIPTNEINKYVSSCDEWNFTYIVTPVLTKNGIITAKLNSNEFEKTNVPFEKFNEHFRTKTKKKRRAEAKYWLKGFGILLCFYAALAVILSPLVSLVFYMLTKNPPVLGIIIISVTASMFVTLYIAMSEKACARYYKLTSSHCITQKHHAFDRKENRC